MASPVLYQAYQAQCDLVAPTRAMASLAVRALESVPVGLAGNPLIRSLSAGNELIARAGFTHRRPAFGIPTVQMGERQVAVHEEAAAVTPFGTLLHFVKDDQVPQPRVLVVAPLSGHFATLLRATLRTLLPEHDVFITDWHNARDVPVEHGPFGLDDYTEHVMRFLELLGPAHVIAVCQPCVPVLAAVALMADASNIAMPKSLTLMAGPIDTRINPTKVNELAMAKPLSWFEQNLITEVPARYPGRGRPVYPGFLQLTAFMNMNLARHVRAHLGLFNDLALGRVAEAQATKDFYDEYFAVLDMTAEFYLETIRLVFQEHCLPRGTLAYRGRVVDPRVITRTALLTVEGANDDICAPGQTLAAHDLCGGLKTYRKRHHLQAGVGHYGVFSGRRWESQIYPIVQNFILANE
jgi:poly(3-hydroxybutyrate) depolymerase